MKNFLKKILLSTALVTILLSCKDQVQLNDPATQLSKAALEEKTFLEGGLMHFASTDGFYKEVNAAGINNLSEEQKQRHAKFTSLSEVYKAALLHLQTETPEVVLQQFRSKYGSDLKISVLNDALVLNQFSDNIAQVIDPQGRVIIANRLFEFSLGKINYTEQPFTKLDASPKFRSNIVTKREGKSSPNARVGRPFYGYNTSANGYFHVDASISDYVYSMPYYQFIDPNLRGSYENCPKCDDYMYTPSYQYEYRGSTQHVSIKAHIESRNNATGAWVDGAPISTFSSNYSFSINASEVKNYYVQCYQNGQETADVTSTDVGNRSGSYALNSNDDYHRAEYNFTLYDTYVNADITNFYASFTKTGNNIGSVTATITW